MVKLDARRKLQQSAPLFGAPCQAVCPVSTDARAYVTLLGEGRLPDAYRAARDFNPLVNICAYVCSAPCEDVCTRGEFGQPVRIRQIKRFITESFQPPAADRQPAKATGHRVAVVGAGPAGLAAAHDLALAGHAVTVYEAAAELGGMATLGVPPFRLPREAIGLDVQSVRALGVSFKPGVSVGINIPLADLRTEYDAVVLCCGATQPNSLAVPGSELNGVVQAIAFLAEANSGGRPACGRRVAVIGGGYTAMDAARTAVRLGAEEATILYRRSRHESEVGEAELTVALSEGVRIEYLVSPRTILGDGAGRVSGLVCVRNRLGEPDASNRPRPLPIEGSEFQFPADTVLTAVGQSPQRDALAPEYAGLLGRIDADTKMTALDGVFAAGDFVSGQSTIIEAVRDGQDVAQNVIRFLAPRGTMARKRARAPVVANAPERALAEPASPNGSRAERSVSGLFQVAEQCLDAETARIEALRCLYCGILPTVVLDDCTLCRACTVVCPVDCLYTIAFDSASGAARPALTLAETVSYQIDADECIRCGRCLGACPTGAIVPSKPEG